MRHSTAALLVLLFTSCAHGDPSRATRIQAFRPDGTNETPKLGESEIANIQTHGVVIGFQQGDFLSVELDLDVEGMDLTVEAPVRIRLTERLFVFSGPRGLQVSRDGSSYQPLSDFFEGSISVGISVAENTKRNTLSIAVDSKLKP